MPLDYLSWLPVVLKYVDTRKGWYMPNWLYYSLQTKKFPLFWSHTWKYNIQANKRLRRVKKNNQLLNLMFLFFLSFFHFNVSDNKCHKHKRHMLFFTRIKLVALVLAWARDHTHQMEKTRVTIKKKKRRKWYSKAA